MTRPIIGLVELTTDLRSAAPERAKINECPNPAGQRCRRKGPALPPIWLSRRVNDILTRMRQFAAFVKRAHFIEGCRDEGVEMERSARGERAPGAGRTVVNRGVTRVQDRIKASRGRAPELDYAPFVDVATKSFPWLRSRARTNFSVE